MACRHTGSFSACEIQVGGIGLERVIAVIETRLAGLTILFLDRVTMGWEFVGRGVGWRRGGDGVGIGTCVEGAAGRLNGGADSSTWGSEPVSSLGGGVGSREGEDTSRFEYGNESSTNLT